MKWELATNDQLLMIVKHDSNCPHSLLSGAVIEMLNRNLFDKIIADSIHHVLKVDYIEQVYKVGMEDLMQIGRMEIFKSLPKFQGNKGKNFISFSYMVVKHQIIKYLVGLQSKKRDTTHVTSIQNSTEQGDEFEIFLEDKQTNVENYVVNKVFIERLLKRVNKHQRAVLYYHLQGYTFNEISQILGRGNLQTMHQAYTLAIKKMRKGA